LADRVLQGWRLFWALAFIVSAAILAAVPRTDFGSAHGMEHIILHSVHCALPFFVLAFVASSLATLFPGRLSRWLLANRRYLGLTFAVGMGWHLGFVAYSFGVFGRQLNFTAIALDATALAFLIAMTLTSFRVFSRYLSATAWRRLHKCGAYVIWLVATEIFFDGVRSGGDRFHIAGLCVLLAAWALRVIAWLRRKTIRSADSRLTIQARRTSL
jgi:methionine sulfoxide reductase heme-binding subunit